MAPCFWDHPHIMEIWSFRLQTQTFSLRGLRGDLTLFSWSPHRPSPEEDSPDAEGTEEEAGDLYEAGL